MLNFMRKQASSWFVKTLLALIILTFVLFFGYSRMADRNPDSRQFVAKIGETHISRRKYEINLEATMNRFRESMKEGFPEGLRKMVEQNVLQQLVQRELMFQYATHLSLFVNDQEIADAIKEDKNIFPDGKFDLVTYREKFLPFYKNSYGENFEEVIRKQLLVEKLGVLADQLYTPWNTELQKSLQTKHKDSSSISPSALFSLWLDHYREEIKTEIYLKQ